jgi:hypothetical protein
MECLNGEDVIDHPIQYGPQRIDIALIRILLMQDYLWSCSRLRPCKLFQLILRDEFRKAKVGYF